MTGTVKNQPGGAPGVENARSTLQKASKLHLRDLSRSETRALVLDGVTPPDYSKNRITAETLQPFSGSGGRFESSIEAMLMGEDQPHRESSEAAHRARPRTSIPSMER